MNPDIKQRWIEALRSGDYKQGISGLRGENSFCCLGVLCDLHSIETGTPWALSDDAPFYLGEASYLPAPVAQWAECDFYPTTPAPKFAVTIEMGLAELNDNGTSFEEIADLIEKYL